MTTSIVVCPHCHYKFNYEFIPGVSFYSLRLGPQRVFKCPNCKHLHRFNVTHFGIDPSLPTHGDNSETGIGAKVWGLLLGPTIVIIAVGTLLQIILGVATGVLILLPLGLAIAWLMGYIAYLVRKSSQYKNTLGN
jgi:hypothetical protein